MTGFFSLDEAKEFVRQQLLLPRPSSLVRCLVKKMATVFYSGEKARSEKELRQRDDDFFVIKRFRTDDLEVRIDEKVGRKTEDLPLL